MARPASHDIRISRLISWQCSPLQYRSRVVGDDVIRHIDRYSNSKLTLMLTLVYCLGDPVEGQNLCCVRKPMFKEACYSEGSLLC